MQCPTHACTAGTDAPTSETAHVASAGRFGEQDDGHHDSRPSAGDNKAFATLRAELALQGYSLSRSSAADGPVSFYVGRCGMVRELPSLAAALAFAEQVGVRNG